MPQSTGWTAPWTKGPTPDMVKNKKNQPAPISTEIAGLDNILAGGLQPGRLYLVEGEPGSGKTTLALQFVAEGARRGEAVVYITLAESEAELRSVADSHGWAMEGIHIHEVIGDEKLLDAEPAVHHVSSDPKSRWVKPSGKLMNVVIRERRPTRVGRSISLSEVQLLAEKPLALSPAGARAEAVFWSARPAPHCFSTTGPP